MAATAQAYHRLLLVFADGVGLAPVSPVNPFAALPAPTLRSLLGGPLCLVRVLERGGLLLRAADATLGVECLPQSATGQAALFTGVNAARAIGSHVVGLPGPRLRALIAEHSIFRRLRAGGRRATFANAYTDGYLERVERGEQRPSVTTCAVAAAGLPFRRLADLERDEAVSWDIERDRFAERAGQAIPRVSAAAAGRHLAALALRHDLTVFETFLTDLAGHGRRGVSPEEAVGRLDGLLGGVLAAGDGALTVLLTSDHGNLEDASTRSHTRHPVPILAVGPLAGEFAAVGSILDLSPTLERLLAAPSGLS